MSDTRRSFGFICSRALETFRCKSLQRAKYRRRATKCVAGETVRCSRHQPDAISTLFLNPHLPAPSNRLSSHVTRPKYIPGSADRTNGNDDPHGEAVRSHSLASIRHKQLYWPVLLALTTGMRRGEILALRWKNVDLERKTLGVTESLEQTASSIRFKRPKSGSDARDHTSCLRRRRASPIETRSRPKGYSGSEFDNLEKRWCAAERTGNLGSQGA